MFLICCITFFFFFGGGESFPLTTKITKHGKSLHHTKSKHTQQNFIEYKSMKIALMNNALVTKLMPKINSETVEMNFKKKRWKELLKLEFRENEHEH